MSNSIPIECTQITTFHTVSLKNEMKLNEFCSEKIFGSKKLYENLI